VSHTGKAIALRYEGFQVGQVIRAEDFQSRDDAPSKCYLVGPIVAVCREGSAAHPYAHYQVKATQDVWGGAETPSSARLDGWTAVPMEGSHDWAGRVTLFSRASIEEGDEVEKEKFAIVLEGAGGELDRVLVESESELNDALKAALDLWDLRGGDVMRVVDMRQAE